jgi:hypothetical protein
MYTPYTLDSYNTFVFDSEEEQIIESYNEQNGTQKTYDDFVWEYKTKEYLQALGENLVLLLNKNILDDVILKVASDNVVYRPREYNFTTDEITLDFIVNTDNLKKYIEDHAKDYKQKK